MQEQCWISKNPYTGNKVCAEIQRRGQEKKCSIILQGISSLENMSTNSDLAERLVHEFHDTDRKSIVSAMLAWLYFGRSYECMVEHGEALIQNSKTNRLHKWLLSLMVKYIIHRSISLGERTKEDWKRF